jgi:hypothetical protein
MAVPLPRLSVPEEPPLEAIVRLPFPLDTEMVPPVIFAVPIPNKPITASFVVEILPPERFRVPIPDLPTHNSLVFIHAPPLIFTVPVLSEK